MSNPDLARRTEIVVEVDGVDVSADMNRYLLSMTYTDHEDSKTDDLRIELDDREGVWLQDWLNKQPETNSPSLPQNDDNRKVGDEVIANGRPKYSSYGDGTPGKLLTDYKGKITYLNLKSGVPYPIHVDAKGWFAESEVTKAEAAQEQENGTDNSGAKGAELHAVIIQKNWESDGEDRVLDCGIFEIDALDSSGPPARVSIKGTSLPHSSTVRTEKKTKAWEKIKLSAIANEIASKNGMKCMYESSYDPLYDRREQVQVSDIVFLQGLCEDAGISIKVTAKIIVLFDAADYEQKETVREIKKGTTDVKTYRFSSKTGDTKYARCHVSYTDPLTKKTIEYTYTPRDADKDGQTLEINEKVKTREEARQLAMKRLRQKNKAEFSAEFTLVGDVRLVAGVTVDVIGYGMFDGKYIIENATHSVTGSGYTLQVKLRRILEGY